jgi:hypothetical protein
MVATIKKIERKVGCKELTVKIKRKKVVKIQGEINLYYK